MNDIFENRKQINGKKQLPVWFMRQAGRYHNHYQNLKKDYDFMQLCKDPKLACEVTMGPIREFDFDAAILFSDLLFPLEQLGLGLIYDPGPILSKKLETLDDVKKLKEIAKAEDYYLFQKQACQELGKTLPADKSLLGFVGAPFTLFAYAAEGSHAGALVSSKMGLYDGRFEAFNEILIPNLLEEVRLQLEGGAAAICLFDTAVGELCRKDFEKYIIPNLKSITAAIKKEFPDKKIVYYSRNTHLDYLERIEDDHIDVLGIDWRMDLSVALKTLGADYFIQGNFDPCWLHLPWDVLEQKWSSFFQEVQENANDFMSKWIVGLGHGVMRTTPQENVKKSVEYIHQHFHY